MSNKYISMEKEIVITDEQTHAWRWRIKHNVDFHGTLDIVYEEISEATRKFETKELFTGMTPQLVNALIGGLEIMVQDARKQEKEHGDNHAT